MAGTINPTHKYLANPIPLFHTPDEDGRTGLLKCWVKNKDTENSFDYLKKKKPTQYDNDTSQTYRHFKSNLNIGCRNRL